MNPTDASRAKRRPRPTEAIDPRPRNLERCGQAESPVPVIVIGAGGHAKVVIDMLHRCENYRAIGCLDAKQPIGSQVGGVPVVGRDDALATVYMKGTRHAFVAIGDNAIRERVTRRVAEAGFELINAVSHLSSIARSVRLGTGIAVMPGAVIGPDCQIGDGVIINTRASVDHDGTVGPFCHIAPGSTLAGEIRLGRQVMIGAGATVVPQRDVGSCSVVGAGAVVVRDLPENVVAMGVPARVVRTMSGENATEHHASRRVEGSIDAA